LLDLGNVESVIVTELAWLSEVTTFAKFVVTGARLGVIWSEVCKYDSKARAGVDSLWKIGCGKIDDQSLER
jgi:hypothetical protein